MIELLEANWPLAVVALVIGILVAWWIFVAMRRTKVETDTSDVLDEGKGPASRNQALIDAAPAATPIPPAGTNTVEAEQPKPSKPAPPSNQEGDDLTRIKGVGPKLKTLLYSLGVTKFAQVADWSGEDIDRIDAQLGKFEGRIRRDNWVEQAKLLAAGDTAGYEDKFGKL